MINTTSIEAVEGAVYAGRFRMPLYGSYCFANIPGTIERVLCGDSTLRALPEDVLGDFGRRYERVVLFLIDAFGWRFLERYRDRYPFLARFAERGVISKLTSQFPSTTSAHVTTLHTGLPVGESGVFEWFYYEPFLDRLIAPLLFSFAGDRTRNTLDATGVEAASLFPYGSFYERLASRGVRSRIYQSKEYTPSRYGDVVFVGAEQHAFSTIAEGLTRLARDLHAEKGRAYFYAYISTIDAMGHQHGSDSPEFVAETDAVFTMLERIFYEAAAGTGDTLMLLTADHGQTNASLAETIYINETMPELPAWLSTGADGMPLAPGGSCRDLFLYVKDEHLTEAHAALAGHLAGVGDVRLTDELMRDGLFGAPGELLRARVGDLCILPYEGAAVWWHEGDRFKQRHIGHHGGLSPAEMETELLAMPL